MNAVMRPRAWRVALVVSLFTTLPVFAQVPSIPTGLTATPDNKQLTLNWAASTNVINYTVKRSTVSGGPYTAVASVTPAVYTDTGLTNGTTYYYVVSASNGSGESANSAQIAAVPSVAPGFLDDEFGGTGRVRTNFNPRVLVNAGGWDAQIQAPNNPNDPNYRKIVVVGTTSEGNRPRFGIIRLNYNGTRDMGFGIRNPSNDAEGNYVNDGTIREVFDDSSWDTFTDALIQPDNKIVAFGYVNKNAGGEDWRVVRYTANGDRDTTFGNSNPKNGIVYFNVPITSAARSKELAIDSQGRIYAAGYGNMVSGDADMFVYRILTDGTIDQSWGDAATPGYARININGFLADCRFNGTPPCSQADQAWSVRVQSTGKVVIAGRANNQPIMMRLYGTATDPDGGGPLPVQRAGTRDTSFGNNGYVWFNVYGVWSGGNPYGSNVGPIDYFRGMTIDPQDRIIGAGRFQYNGVQRGFICRLLPNGAVDTSFGGGDGWTPELLAGQSVFDDVEVTADGKMVATGTVSVNNDMQVAAFRYNADGSADSSFCYRDAGNCISGSAIINVVPGYTEISHGVAIQPDGDVLVPSEGFAVINGVSLEHMMVVRFNGTDGSLDTTFNSAGQVLTSAINKPGVFATRLTGSSADFSYGTAVQPDGKVIQVGQSWNGWDYDFAVTRLTTAGVPDITFGDRAIDCYRAANNSIVCEPYSDYNRRNGKIVLDTGVVTTPDNTDVAYSVAIQSTGRIVIAGTTSTGGAAQTKLFRVYGSDPDGAGTLVAGSLDTTFGTNGFQTNNFSAGGGDRPRKIIVDAQDRIYLVGEVSGGGQSNLVLARYTANGTLEFSNTFNDTFFEEGHDIALQPDGKVVIGGRGAASGAPFQFYVGRFNVNAGFTVDNTFSLGRLFDVATNTIVADSAYQGLFLIPHENRATPTALNTNPTGTALSTNDEATSVVVEADGKITLGGRTVPVNTGQPEYQRRPRYALARLTSSGWLDTTFGTNGWVETTFEITAPTTDLEDSAIRSLVAQNDGKLVGMGTVTSNFDPAIPGSRNDADFSVARYNWDNGSLDTAFGVGGKKTVGFGTAKDEAFSGLMASNGKIILGGHDTVREDFVAVRWHGDSGPSGTHSSAPDLSTDSTRANYAGTTDNRTNDNSPTFTGSPCVSGESIILKVVNTATSAEHFYKARDLCRAADNNAYGATVPSYSASGGSFVYGQSAVAFLPDATYNVQAFSATGGGSTALSPTLSNVIIDTRADLPPITSPTANPIEKKNAEQGITFTGTGAETTADVTVWDTWNPDAVAPPPPPGSPAGASRVVWSATTGRITTGAPVPVCTAFSVAAGGNWTCQTPAHPAVGALALGHHRIKSQQEDIAGNKSVLCIPPGTTQWPIGTVHETCTAEVQFYVKANTTTSASSSVNPSVYGQSVIFTTSVRSNVGTPAGAVVQTYDNVAQPAATLNVTADATYAPALPLSVGTHTFSASYAETDKYFASATVPPPLSQVVNKADTAGTVTSALGNGVNSVYGQSVSITVAIDVTGNGRRQGVACPACANPTGTVTVKIDGGVPQSLTYSNLQATFTSTALSVGPHTLEFTYSGDGNFNGVTSSYSHTVDKGATTTAVTSSANPSVSGQPVTLTGTVTANTPAAGTRTGTLHFKNGGVSITGCQSVSINASGVGTCVPAALATTSHAMTADYSGDGNFLASAGSLTQVVNKANTSGVLTSTVNPSTFGQSTTLTVTLSVTAPGSGTVTGTVEFRSVGVAITGCTAQPVNAGVATCATTAITAGTRALTAVYTGDTNFNTSTSNSVSQVVNKANTTTALTVDFNPSRSGEAVTFTATMAAVGPGAGTPTGTINFRDNLVTIPGCGTQTLTAGVATCTVSTLSIAAHPITAVYSSDANFNASTSNTINQDVQKGDSATTVTSSANPSVSGQTVTFTSTITPVSPASGTPSGTVTFKNGGVDITGCINKTLALGIATCDVLLNLGSYTITADYSGDGGFNGSSGTLAGGQTVNKSSTSNTITVSPLNAVFGQTVTVTSTVAASGGGTGTPTGTATFTIDSVAGSPGTLDGTGAMSTTVAALAVGPHTFSNTYDGDTNFHGSTGSLNYTVNPAQTSVVIGGAAGTTVVGEAFTVSATISVTAPGAGTPTGNVTIGDGTDSCTVTLAGGTGSCSLTLFTPGVRTLTATYSGDLSFATSSSTASQTVNAAATTTTITGHTPAPSSVGGAVLVTFTVTATAPGSGTPAGTVTISDGVDTCSATVAAGQCSITLTSFGTRTLTATFAGTPSYLTSSGTASHHVKPPTTTSITSDTPDPSAAGQTVVVQFTVTDPNALGTPTGTVTVSDGVDTCSAPVATGQCSLTLSTIGLRTLTASYGGDATYDASAGTTSHRVKGDTAVTISSTVPSSSVSGQSVQIQYSVGVVAPGIGTPSGNVTITDGTASCTGTVAAGQCAITFATAGARSLTATYAGDTDYNGSTSTVFAHTVGLAATTITLSDTPDPSLINTPVNVTWNLTVDAPGAGTPTGTVTVTDGVDSCSAPLASGGCSITLMTQGARTLTASYSGDSNFAATSASAAHQVKANTTTAISGTAPSTSVSGQGVAVSWNVTVTAPGTGTPSGTVTVTDGASTCSAAVGAGSCTIAFPAVGVHNLVATYSGDSTYNGSTSANFPHTVTQGSTTTTITSVTPSPSMIAAATTVSFTVTANPPGGGTPTGNVTVSNGTDSCTGTVAAGQCSITFTHAGSQSLTAVYAGDANYATSMSAIFTHNVNRALTSLAITTHTPDPSIVGAAVNVTWALIVLTPGAGTATGLVTVSDGVDSCSAPVAAGGCSMTLTTLGARTLTAAYAGDGDFSPASTTAPHAVRANTTTTISGTSPTPTVTGQAVTISWNVAIVAPGTGTPTGTVNVTDGVSSCSAAVGAGSCTIAFLSVGVHNLIATYGGDATYNGSTSAGFNHTVAQASTTTTITSLTPSPSMIAAATTVSFTVSANPPGGGTPTGNVTVSNGTDSCTGTVAAGQCSITFTHAGAHSLTAVYAGDANYATSTSAVFAHSVNRALTSLAITGHAPDPSITGGAVNVTWTLTVLTPGAGTATGLVTVSDGVDSCNAPVATGGCSITLNTLGSRTLTASYAGDADFSPASTTASHSVRANTTITISGTTPATTVTGQSVAISWNVGVVAPGAGTPTGTVTVTDGTSSCSAAVGAGTCSVTLPTAGNHSFVATYGGDAIYNASTSAPAVHVVSPAATATTIVSANPNPSTVGVAYPVLFTVAPVAPGTGTPTGTVTVTDGTDSCSASVAAGQCNLTSTTIGAKNLAATYAGDANFATGTSPGLAHQVMGASALTINASTPNPSVSGQTVAITVTAVALPPAVRTPTGTVTVSDGTQSCTITLSGGTGSCSLTFATTGARTLSAAYGGDANYAGSSTTSTHNVQPASTTAAITSRTPATSVSGQAVVIAFSVTVNGPGAGTPTGTVTISDGTQSCSATVAAGQCSIAFSTSGARNLTASYSGDGNFAASASAPVAHTANQADTATTIVSHDANPSVAGQQITAVFTVLAVAPGAGTPTGNVTVQASTGESCTATAAIGQCSITFANPGARTLTATYAGDANFNASASAPAPHTVDKANTTTAITGHTPATSIPGEAVVVTWSVAVSAPGASPVTGAVTVSDGTVSCNAPVAAGQCVLTFATTGTKTLVGTFSGDANLNGSTSAAVAHVVNRAPTTTAITAHTPDPSQTAAPVRVQFTVSALPPATGTPTGSVTVSDGAASCSGTVAAGECTLILNVPVGAHTLTAVYSGDANFAPSTSAGVTHQLSNRAPQAQGDSYTGHENGRIEVRAPGLLSNDSDPDGPQPMRAALMTGPARGNLTLNSDGSFIYVPRSGFEGTDSFTYQACDSLLCSSTTNVAIRIWPSLVPTATVTGSTTICAGSEATLQVVLTGTGPWTLTWSDGPTETVTTTSATRTVQPPATTTYTITSVSNANGSAAGSGSAMVTVIAVPQPTITTSSPIAFTQPLTLTATGGYTSYQWYRNNAPIAGATSAVFAITALAPSDLGNYSVTGTRDGCESPRSAGVTIAPVDEESIISVIGATPGAGGSKFRTVMQLTNGKDETIDGSIEWSVTGGVTTNATSSYPFSLAPGQTRYIDDLLPPGFTGLASASIKQIRGGLPLGLVHVFNDMGGLGTTGMLQRTLAASAALTRGDRAVLITPADPAATRFNIGMRALRSGLQVRITRRDADGKGLGVSHASLDANGFSQTSANALIGDTIGGGDSLEFEILSGGGIIYGAATDNKTNDPNMQMAAKIAPRLGSGTSVIAVAGSVVGAFGSRFATEAQIHNGGTEAMEATLRFHPAAASGKADDPSLKLTIAPRATITMPDVVASLGTSGLGSMDIVTTSATQPIAVVRVYSVSDSGQTSMTEDVIPIEAALRQGEKGIILAPHDLEQARFNIGIRSLEEGATLTVTVRNADGTVAKVITLNYPANYFIQSAAGALLEMDLRGDQQILFRVDQGSAVIYGVWTDNKTQDPSLQFAVRP